MEELERSRTERDKFIRHFAHLGSTLRFPKAYAQFAAKPNGTHERITFDALGFRNLGKNGYLPGGRGFRVFVLGGSTMVEGDDEADTVSGRLETILRRSGLEDVQVFNFGVVSSCFAQMSALAWSHLALLRPDALIVVGGGTDVTNPWTFDPRPGQPYNAFAIEEIYDHLFATERLSEGAADLTYDRLTDLLYGRIEQLRLACGWRTEAWEEAIADKTLEAIRQFSTLATALTVPVLCVLQPTIVRTGSDPAVFQKMASEEFLAYLDRQYTRLQAGLADCADRGEDRELYRVLDLSGLFAGDRASFFYDPAHYSGDGRQIMAETLAGEVLKSLKLQRRRAVRFNPLGNVLRLLKAG
jgi:lysophospholipase L1-like esterase